MAEIPSEFIRVRVPSWAAGEVRALADTLCHIDFAPGVCVIVYVVADPVTAEKGSERVDPGVLLWLSHEVSKDKNMEAVSTSYVMGIAKGTPEAFHADTMARAIDLAKSEGLDAAAQAAGAAFHASAFSAGSLRVSKGVPA